MSGSFTISDPDATDTLTIVPGTYNGSYGNLTIALVGGTYTWSYQLNNNVDNNGAVTPNVEPGLDTFNVTVVDGHGGSATQLLTVKIGDDVPSIRWHDGRLHGQQGNDSLWHHWPH